MNEPHCKVKDEANRPLSLEIWTDLGYVCASKKATEHWVEFTVYKISGLEANGCVVFDNVTDMRNQQSDYIEDAEVFVEADIKWDGCSNWCFFPADHCCPHFCSQRAAANLGVLLSRIYDKAKELMGRDELG